MRLGVCTTDFPRMEIKALFETIAALGFTVVQFNFSSISEFDFEDTGEFEIPWSVSGDIIADINLYAAQCGLTIVAANGTFNCAHPDRAVREEGIARFEGFAAAVKKLGCPAISLCTGTRNPAYLWESHPDNDTPEAWNDMLEVVQAITAIAERYDLTLLIETEASNVVNTPEKAKKLMEAVGSDHLKIVMDCANLFHIGTAYKDNARHVMKHAFDVLADKIVLAHGKDISESDGIEFCATGDGIVDYGYFFELLKASGYMGDMVVHGIFSEAGMRRAVNLLKPLADDY